MEKIFKNKKVLLAVAVILVIVVAVAVMQTGKKSPSKELSEILSSENAEVEQTISEKITAQQEEIKADEITTEEEETTEVEKVLNTFDKKYIINEVLSEDEKKGAYLLADTGDISLFVRNTREEYKFVVSDEFTCIEAVAEDFSQFFFTTKHGLHIADFEGNVTDVSDKVRMTSGTEGTSVVTYDDMTAYYLGNEENPGLHYYDGTENRVVDENATDFVGFPGQKYVIYNTYNEQSSKPEFSYAKGTKTGDLSFPENLWYFDIIAYDDNYIYYKEEDKNYRLGIYSDAQPEIAYEIPDMGEY